MKAYNDLRRKVISIYSIFIIIVSGLMGFLVFNGVVDEEDMVVEAKTIIVDAGGNGNYTTIQAAIDAANTGDTIRVWAGTYNEEVVIKKSLNLIGNGTKNTTIKGKKSNSVIDIDRTNGVNVTGFTVTDSGTGDLDAGILVWRSDFCNIYNNNVSNNGKFGIFLYYSSNCSIRNNTFLHNYKGIFIVYSDNNIIKNNSCNYNGKGIDIRGKWGNYIENNICKSNSEEGIDIQSQSRCYILNNTCKNNDQTGIYFAGQFSKILNNICISNYGNGISIAGINNTIGNNLCFDNNDGVSIRFTNNLVFNNNCTNNSEAGILLRSGYNTIWNNTLINCGFSLSGDKLEDWNTNSLYVNNTVNNKPLYFLKNQTIGKVPVGVPQVILANCSNIIVENLTLNNASIGIIIGFSNNITIRNNTCSFNGLSGMGLYNSLNNYILNNKYNNNDIGLELDFSSYNKYINNTCDSNNWEGIKLDYSSNNIFINNTCNSNRYGFRIMSSSNYNLIINTTCNFNEMDGIRFYGRDSHYNILVNNSCSFNDRMGIYLDGDPFDFPPFIFLNTTIINNNCSNNSHGLWSKGGWNTIIKENTIYGNQNYGCYFEGSTDNEIAFNIIDSNNQHGIYLRTSFNNTIYNNNFSNNNNHAYDDGNNHWNLSTSIGGNYWDNWTSPDNNMDGYVDYPFLIPGGNNKDFLPLVIKNSSYYRVHNINKNTSYTSIQTAVDDANVGDKIRVWAGTYYENVKVHKTVTLIGNGTINTTIYGSGIGDVVTITANWVNITGFRVMNSGSKKYDAGIKLINVDNCSIVDNNCSSNWWAGIYIEFSSNNMIINNTSNYNQYYGFHIGFSSMNKVENNTCNSNKHSGIDLDSSSNNTFTNNTCNSNNQMGIIFHLSSNNIIANNTCSLNTDWGIGLRLSSNNNTIINNTCSSNNMWGIVLAGGLNNKLFKNTMLSCGLFTTANTHTIDITNTVNGKPVYYWKNQAGGIIPSGAGQVILANCTNVIIENQNLSNGSIGIILSFSNNNTINNNTCNFNNRGGIYLLSSSTNIITNNTCLDNYYDGIYLDQSSNNSVTNSTCLNNYDGIALRWYSSNNSISNNTCSNNDGSGIYIIESHNNSLLSNILIRNSKGIHINTSSDNCHIINTLIINSTNYDIQLNEDSHAFALNCSLNWSKIKYVDKASNLTVQWYLNIKVINNTGNPVSDANILIKNNFTKQTFSGKTNYKGYYKWIICDQYIENSNGIITQFSPFNVTVNKTSYDEGYANPEPIMDSSKTIAIIIDYDLTPPNPPSNLIFKNIGGNFINLSWIASDSYDVEGYNVYINDTGSNSSFHHVDSTTNNYFNKTDLLEETRYYFIVTAFDDIPWESSNLTGNCTTIDVTAPSPPSVLKILNYGGTYVNLSWTGSTSLDLEGYQIYINNTGSSTNFHLLTITKNTTFNHTGLAQETTYYYKVRAYDEVPLYSSFSNTVSTKTLDITPPNPPSSLNILKNGGKYLELTWSSSTSNDVQGYEVYINDTGSSVNFHYLTTTTSTFFNHTGVLEKTTYYYKVRAFDEVPLYSLFSNSISVTTLDISAPAAPTNLQAKNPTGNLVTLTWDPNTESDLAGYHIYMNNTGASATGPFHIIHTISGSTTQYIVTGLREITTYHFVVVAFDEVPNNSSFSNVASATTLDVTAPKIIHGSGSIQTTTGENFKLFAEFQDNVGIELVKIIYTKSITWNEKNITSSINGNYSITSTDLSIDTTNDISTWKYYFYAEDSSGNHVYYGAGKKPFIITVIDNDNPVANAGRDIDRGDGDTVIFNASDSTDNIGIINYSWSFNYASSEIILFGKIAKFKFDRRGDYEVTLKVIDSEGNWDTDTVKVSIYLRDHGIIHVQLISPSNDAILKGPNVVLNWSVLHPTDDYIISDVYFGTTPDPPFYKTIYGTTELEVSVIENTTYYWNILPRWDSIDGLKTPTWSFKTLPPEPKFEVNITSEYDTWRIMQGETRRFLVTVENIGTIPDLITLEVDIQHLQDNITIEISEKDIELNPNKLYEIEIVIKTNRSTIVGLYQLLITAISRGAQDHGLNIKNSTEIYLAITTGPPEDFDGDNLPDYWEIDYFDSIDKFDGNDDPDLDGRTNLQEYKDETDPTTPDTGPDITKPKKGEEEKSNFFIILVGIISIISVLLLILIIFIILRRIKGGGKQPDTKPQEPISPTPSTYPPAQHPPQQPQQNDFLNYNTQDQD